MMNETFGQGTSGEGTANHTDRPYNQQPNQDSPRSKRPRIQRNTSVQRETFQRRDTEAGGYQRPYEGYKRTDNYRSNRPFDNNGTRRSNNGEERNRYPYNPNHTNDSNRYNRPNTNRGRSFDGEHYGNRYQERHEGNTYQTLNEGLRLKRKDGSEQVYGRQERNNGYEQRRPYQRRNGNIDPNAHYARKKMPEFKPRETDMNKPVRLNKYLANAGICSRREADEYIQAGVISVNGQVITELGSKILPTDKVMFHDQPIRSEKKVYLLLNKPKNCVTTTEDTHERTTVLDLVKNACSERIYPVGRLDRNTTGVLLLTNDGDLASKLTHPKFNKKKIYHATLDKPLDIEAYQTLMGGVELDGETIRPDELEFTDTDDRTKVGIEIHSGQNRVVRRLFERVGYKVIKLDRVFFAGLTKKNLPRGKYRFLTPREINMLLMGAFE